MREKTYCLSCRKYTKKINPKIVKNKNNQIVQYAKVKNLDLLKNN